VDILSKNELNFRVIEWEIGANQLDQSSVTLQIVAKDHTSMDETMDLIEKGAAKKNIQINEGTGPAFEDTVFKMIHQDRVR